MCRIKLCSTMRFILSVERHDFKRKGGCYTEHIRFQVEVLWVHLLGCFMDPGGITLITVPVFMPIVKSLGFDPLWFGVIFCMNMQIAHLSPPFGFNLFFMRAVTREEEITMVEIYRSAVPFMALEALAMVVVMIFPEIAQWLPNLVFGSGS